MAKEYDLITLPLGSGGSSIFFRFEKDSNQAPMGCVIEVRELRAEKLIIAGGELRFGGNSYDVPANEENLVALQKVMGRLQAIHDRIKNKYEQCAHCRSFYPKKALGDMSWKQKYFDAGYCSQTCKEQAEHEPTEKTKGGKKHGTDK